MNEKYLRGFFDNLIKPKQPDATYEEWVSAISDNSQYKQGMFNTYIKPKQPDALFEDWDSSVFGGGTVKKKESTQEVGQPSGSTSFSPLASNIDDSGLGGSFQEVAQQTVPMQQPTARPKEPKSFGEQFAAGLRGQDNLGQAMAAPSEAMTSFTNTISNVKVAAMGVPDRVVLGASSIWKNLLGEDLANTLLYNPEGRDVNLEAQIAVENLNKLSEEYKETANLIDAIGSGNVPMIAAGIADAGASVVVPLIENIISGGAVLALDMFGTAVKDYNEEKAKRLGLEEQELYANNLESVGIPAVVGGLSYALERAGMKRMTKAISEYLNSPILRRTVLGLMATGGESFTEWVQVGLEAFNRKYAETQNMEESVKFAASMMASKEGGEAALKGAAGSGVITSAGILVKKMATIQKGDLTPKDVAELAVELNNNPEVMDAVMESAVALGEITAEQRDAVLKDIQDMESAFDKVPEAYADRIADLAPLIFEKSRIDQAIAEVEVQKAKTDETLVGALDGQIAELNQQKQAINDRIQQTIAPTKASTTKTDGTEVRADEGAVGTDGGGVQEVGATNVQELNQIQNEEAVRQEAGQRPVLEELSSARDENQEGQASPQLRAEEEVQVVDSNEEYNSIRKNLIDKENELASIVRGLPENSIERKNALNDYQEAVSQRERFESKNSDLILKHGTPHDFDKFLFSKIGTGEGNQAFGYGLYFTEDSKIAKSYADKLSKDKEGLIYTVKVKDGRKKDWLEWRDSIESIDLNKISESLKDKRAKYYEYLDSVNDEKSHTGAAEILFNESPEIDAERIQAGAFYMDMAEAFGQQEATEIMKQAGLSGIKYKSRKGLGDAFNYVVFDPESISITEKKKSKREAPQAEASVTQEEAPKQKVMNLAANREITSAIESDNMPEFRKSIKQAIADATKTKEGKSTLNKAANAQLAKLINNANTPQKAKDAVDYMDNLLANAELRKAFNDASEAIDSSKKRMKGLAGAQEPLTALSNINARGIKKVELLKKIATALDPKGKLPTQQEIATLAKEVVTELQNSLKKDVELKEETIAKRIDTLFKTKKRDADNNLVKDKDGNQVMEDAAFDTKQKVRGLVKRLNNLADAVDSLNLPPEQQEVYEKMLDRARAKVDDIAIAVGESLAKERTENIKNAAKKIKSITASNFVNPKIYETYIAPLKRVKDALGKNLNELSYSQSVRLSEALDYADSGYLPLNFYRSFTEPLTGIKQTRAIIDIARKETPNSFLADFLKIANNPAESARKMANTVRSFTNKNTPKSNLPLTEKSLQKVLDVTFLSDIDDLFGTGTKFRENMTTPLFNALNVINQQNQDMMASFMESSGTNLVKLLSGDATEMSSLFKTNKSFNKVGAYLVQRRVNSEKRANKWNVLKHNAEFAGKEKEKGVVANIDAQSKKMWEELNKEHPNGVELSDLTAKEKKMVEAFDNIVSTLEERQEIDNLRRGLPFEAIEGYAPLLYLAGEVGYSEKMTESNDFASFLELLSGESKPQKNVKIRSDRGLQSNPDTDAFVAQTNVMAMLNNMVQEVNTSYYLFPIVYNANRSFSRAENISKNTVPKYLRKRYADELRRQNSVVKSKAGKVLNRILGATYADFLIRPNRYLQEFASGALLQYSYPDALKNPQLTGVAMKEAVTSSKDGSFKKAMDLTKEDAFNKFEEIEISNDVKRIRNARKYVGKITSPDSFQESTFARIAFVLSLKVKYKELTGNSLSMSSLNDASFFNKNKDALKESADYAMSEVAMKRDTQFGRPVRPFAALPWFDTTASEGFALAQQLSFFLGNFGWRQGNLFLTRLYNVATANSMSRGLAFSLMSVQLAAFALYQMVRESADYFYSLVTADDDEEESDEMKRKELHFSKTVRSPQWVLGQFGSSFAYLTLSPQGSVGKSAIYVLGEELLKNMKKRYQESGKTVAEFERDSKVLRNAIKDATYKELSGRERQAQAEAISIAAGGLGIAYEQSKDLYDAILSSSGGLYDAAMGKDGIDDRDIENIIYTLGTAWNLTYARRTVPFPFLDYISKSTAENKKSIDKIARDATKSDREKKRLIKELVLVYGASSIKNEMTPSESIEKIRDEAFKYLPNEDKKELKKAISNEMDRISTPMFIKQIEGAANPRERGVAAAKWQKKINAMTDRSKAAEMQIEMDERFGKILNSFSPVVRKKNEEFIEFYNNEMTAK